MFAKYEVGQKAIVKSVSTMNQGDLTVGKAYEVLDIKTFGDQTYLTIKTDTDFELAYHASRFE